MAELGADTVGQRLRDGTTRAATLQQLEALDEPIDAALSLSAAPALHALLSADFADVDRATFDRAGLLLGRLHLEAVAQDDVCPVHAAAFGDGGCFRLLNADSARNLALLSKPASELTKADAISAACLWAYFPSTTVRGWTQSFAAAGVTVPEWFKFFIGNDPLVSQQKQPSDAAPRRMLSLLLELLKANELPDELAVGGAWWAAATCLFGRPAVAVTALDCGIFELAVVHLNAIGNSMADRIVSTATATAAVLPLASPMCTCDHVLITALCRQSNSATASGIAQMVLMVVNIVFQSGGQDVDGTSRPDLGRCVSSGLFDLCIETVLAFAAAGEAALPDTNPTLLYNKLGTIARCREQPGGEAKIRAMLPRALSFCLEHPLEASDAMAWSTGTHATAICELHNN
jgi:hypothetical protein